MGENANRHKRNGGRGDVGVGDNNKVGTPLIVIGGKGI